MIALKLDKRVYVMPNSFGPFRGPFVARMVRAVLSKCTVVSSRESISLEMLHEMLDFAALSMPDLGFFLESKDSTEMRKYLVKQGVPLDTKKCVAITMRPYRFPGSSDPQQLYQAYKDAFIGLIHRLDREGLHVVLVEHTLSSHSHENDGRAIKEITPHIEGCGYSVISNDSLDCRQLKALYSWFDYVIGTRFHSVIFSMAEGVPSIAVTYGGNKGDGIMKDIGLSEFAIAIDKVSADLLWDKFELLQQNDGLVRDKIARYLEGAGRRRKTLVGIIGDSERKHISAAQSQG